MTLTDEPPEDPAEEFIPVGADDRPLTAFDLRVYERAGLGPVEAQSWAQAGIAPYQAEGFRSAGVDDLEEALEWVARGVSGNTFASWARNGLDPEAELAARAELDRLEARSLAEREQRAAALEADAERLQAELAGGLRISIGEIAELAGVSGPSVVSNWRRRLKGFPEPRTPGRNPRFNAGEVLAWLRAEDKIVDGRDGAVRPEADWFWYQTIVALPLETPEADRGHLRAFVAALVTLAAVLDGELAEPSRVAATCREMPDTLEEARRAAVAAADAKPSLAPILAFLGRPDDPRDSTSSDPVVPVATPSPDGFRQVALAVRLCAIDNEIRSLRQRAAEPTSWWERLDGALSILADPTHATSATLGSLAWLMAEMLPEPGAGDVLDPACGEGQLLLDLGRKADRLYGIDIDPEALCVARARFLLSGRPVELAHADALSANPFRDRTFAAVLIDPPTGPKSPGPAEWVDLATRALTPTGRAVIVVPRSALEPGGPLAPTFRRGRVGTVILLPGTARHSTRQPFALCVLAGADETYDEVLVVDLADVDLSRLGISSRTPVPNLSRSSYPVRSTSQQKTALLAQIRAWLDDPGMGILPRLAPNTTIAAVDAATVGVEGVELVMDSQRAPSDDLLESARLLRSLLGQQADVPQARELRLAVQRFLRENQRRAAGEAE